MLFAKQFDFTQLSGYRILFLGIGGGSDAISAYICSQMLQNIAQNAAYGNTKQKTDAGLCMLSKHIGYTKNCEQPISTAQHGTLNIDNSLPRGANHSPLVFIMDKQNSDAIEQLAQEIVDIGNFDFIVAVDTGGDSLKTKGVSKSRDTKMLKVIQATKIPSLLFVLAMASDGISPIKLKPRLDKLCKADAYSGYFPLLPYQDLFKKRSVGLQSYRTPNIILSALDSDDSKILVPRGGYYKVHREWLINGFVFSVDHVLDGLVISK